MRTFLPWMAALAIIPLTVGVLVSAQTKAPAKTAKKAPAKTASKTTARKGAKKTARRQPVATWRNRQAVPSADRYREVQTALVAKGYLREEEVTGQWSPASIDALKRFQSEQSLEASGKLNSLSLIALGLGPKYDARAATSPPATVPPRN